MNEVRPGVWHWTSPHPDWDAEQWWPQLVSSYAIKLGDDVVLFDPLAVPDELRERATAVVLTAPYHERDARGLGLPIHTPPADTWQDWVEKLASTPRRCAGWRAKTSPGFVRARARAISTVPGSGRSASPRTQDARTTI